MTLANAQKDRRFEIPTDTATDLLFDEDGMDTVHASEMILVLKNEGASQIDTLTRTLVTLGKVYEDPTNFGPLSPGASLRLRWTDVRGSSVRLIGWAAAATAVTVEAAAYSD